ncbi:MAG: hypothetical protein AAFY20_23360 [Cyanobacteria bacterium J06639_14]
MKDFIFKLLLVALFLELVSIDAIRLGPTIDGTARWAARIAVSALPFNRGDDE